MTWMGWGVALVSNSELDVLMAPVFANREEAERYMFDALSTNTEYTYVPVQLQVDLADSQSNRGPDYELIEPR